MLVSEAMASAVAATPPTLTAVAVLNPIPVSVTVVPPAIGPAAGAMAGTVGGGTTGGGGTGSDAGRLELNELSWVTDASIAGELSTPAAPNAVWSAAISLVMARPMAVMAL